MVKDRNPDVKTKRHLRKEKKKEEKKDQKEMLLSVKRSLSTTEKANLDPFQPVEPTRCNRCGKGFGDVSGARSHRSEKYPDCKFPCPRSKGEKPTCGCVFPSKKDVERHQQYHKKGGGIMTAAAEEKEDGEEEDGEDMIFFKCEVLQCHMM